MAQNPCLSTELEIHKDEAHQSHQYYLETIKHYQEKWDSITTQESKEDKTEEELSTLDTCLLSVPIIKCGNLWRIGDSHLNLGVHTTIF